MQPRLLLLTAAIAALVAQMVPEAQLSVPV